MELKMLTIVFVCVSALVYVGDTDGSFCCEEGAPCCDIEEACCGSECCEDDFVCCDDEEQDTCCETKEDCCGSECCKEFACCTVKDNEQTEKTCCGKDMCCNDGECSPQCASQQFDAFPCESDAIIPVDTTGDLPVCINYKLEGNGILYRFLNSEDSCQGLGLSAKDPLSEDTINTHVECVSSRGFRGPYISTTSTIETPDLNMWLNRGKAANVPLARINTTLLTDCDIFDLTDDVVRDKVERLAGKNTFCEICEVLIRCPEGVYVPCEEMPYPPLVKNGGTSTSVTGGIGLCISLFLIQILALVCT